MTEQIDNTRVEIVKGELCTVTLKPGDRLALICDAPLRKETIQHFSEKFSEWAPGVKVLVLDGGLRLAVVRCEGKTDAQRAAIEGTDDGLYGNGESQPRGLVG